MYCSPVMTVLVSPVQVSVEVDSRMIAECAVIGNLVEKITWRKDIEDSIKGKVQYNDYSLLCIITAISFST